MGSQAKKGNGENSKDGCSISAVELEGKTNKSLMCEVYLDVVLAVILRLPGLRMSLSRMLTICSNLGRLFLSFCQQSNISW